MQEATSLEPQILIETRVETGIFRKVIKLRDADTVKKRIYHFMEFEKSLNET